MLHRIILFFICCFSGAFGASIPDSVRQSYAKKMQEGFFLQSIGKTRQAFYTFQDGYQEALQAGESIVNYPSHKGRGLKGN